MLTNTFFSFKFWWESSLPWIKHKASTICTAQCKTLFLVQKGAGLRLDKMNFSMESIHNSDTITTFCTLWSSEKMCPIKLQNTSMPAYLPESERRDVQ